MRVGPLGIPEIAIIVVVILLIFGAKRLPEIGTSMGKGIRTFKTALMGDDEKDEAVRGNDDSNSSATSVIKPRTKRTVFHLY